MKYLLSAALAAFLMIGAASAQHMNVGVKVGLNLFDIASDDNSSNDMKAGIHIGLLGHFHLTETLAFQPEVVFSGQGAKVSSGVVDSKLNLDYINVPLLLQYMFDNGFRLQAGPQIGFLIAANSDTDPDDNIDVKSNYKSVDFGLGIGGGYVHPPSGFGVDLRYNFGLSNINENNAVNSTNNGVQLGVFYLFGHKS
ncbi:MAG: porin family protein [Saprospiraceae bacterium]